MSQGKCNLGVGVKLLYVYLNFYSMCMLLKKHLKCAFTQTCSLKKLQQWVILEHNLQYSHHSEKLDLGVGVKLFYVY